MFALVKELYLRTWVGCGPTEEGSGDGSIVVWRVSVDVIVVLCVCGQSQSVIRCAYEKDKSLVRVSCAVVFLHVGLLKSSSAVTSSPRTAITRRVGRRWNSHYLLSLVNLRKVVRNIFVEMMSFFESIVAGISKFSRQHSCDANLTL